MNHHFGAQRFVLVCDYLGPTHTCLIVVALVSPHPRRGLDDGCVGADMGRRGVAVVETAQTLRSFRLYKAKSNFLKYYKNSQFSGSVPQITPNFIALLKFIHIAVFTC